MTARSPPPQKYRNFETEPKESNKTDNSKLIDYNGTTTNKASINQSSLGGKNTNTSTNEKKSYYAKPVENYSSLFDTEIVYLPRKRTEPKNEEAKEVSVETKAAADNVNRNDYGNTRQESYTALERSVRDTRDRVQQVDDKVEALDSNWKTVPHRVGEAESTMVSKGNRVDELEWRNKLHSAKIHDLENELRNVKIENSRIKGQLGGHTLAAPIPEESHTYRNGYERDAPYDSSTQQQAYPGARDMAQRQGPPQPGAQAGRQYENEQHRIAHRVGGPDEEPYWGFNRYYDPQFVTAYRREHIPYYANLEEREKQTQYADDYNYLQDMQRRQEEEWRRKRQEEEEKLMKDKPKTYDYTAPYQALFPPRDVNKYFHDSKYLEDAPEPKPDEYYFEADVPFRQNPGTGITTYERTFVSPRHPNQSQQPPGGLYFIRFHDSGFDEVNVSLKEQQTIIKSFHGYVLGIARKQNIMVIEGDAEWRYSRQQVHRPQVRINYRSVEDAIALLWFPNRDKAFDFFSNSFRNRFRQQGFPTPHSWEGHFIPMLTPPLFKTLDTYLILELINAQKYPAENVQSFEAETRQDILKAEPNSLPFVASAFKGRDPFKPGPLFRDKSKVFICRFNSMSELANVWDRGVIQRQLEKWNLTGPLNVSAFSLKDWFDY